MRPDEHKRKKNEQYKKKHGIKTTKEKAGKGKNVDKSASSGVTSITKTEIKHTSDDEEVEVHRHFARRKVESNWHRYESEEQEVCKGDSQGPSGADFKQLLAQTVSSSSHFRFKEEQVWDSEELKHPPQLSVDCDGLLPAVLCTPLHERLDVDTIHFQKEQLDNFSQFSNRCLQSYEEQQKQTKNMENRNQDNYSDESMDLPQSEIPTLPKTSTEVHKAENEMTSTKASTGKSKEDNVASINSGKAAETKTGNIKANDIAAVNDNSPVSSNEPREIDDLDKLLGISSNSTDNALGVKTISPTKSTDTNPVSTDQCAKQSINLEDQLDELLNLGKDNDSAKKASSGNQEQSIVLEGPDKAAVGSSLEDFLDDLLDD